MCAAALAVNGTTGKFEAHDADERCSDKRFSIHLLSSFCHKHSLSLVLISEDKKRKKKTNFPLSPDPDGSTVPKGQRGQNKKSPLSQIPLLFDGHHRTKSTRKQEINGIYIVIWVDYEIAEWVGVCVVVEEGRVFCEMMFEVSDLLPWFNGVSFSNPGTDSLVESGDSAHHIWQELGMFHWAPVEIKWVEAPKQVVQGIQSKTLHIKGCWRYKGKKKHLNTCVQTNVCVCVYSL